MKNQLRELQQEVLLPAEYRPLLDRQRKLAMASGILGVDEFFTDDALQDPSADLWRSLHGIDLVQGTVEFNQPVSRDLNLQAPTIAGRFLGLYVRTDKVIEDEPTARDIFLNVLPETLHAPYSLRASDVTAIQLNQPPRTQSRGTPVSNLPRAVRPAAGPLIALP